MNPTEACDDQRIAALVREAACGRLSAPDPAARPLPIEPKAGVVGE